MFQEKIAKDKARLQQHRNSNPEGMSLELSPSKSSKKSPVKPDSPRKGTFTVEYKNIDTLYLYSLYKYKLLLAHMSRRLK